MKSERARVLWCAGTRGEALRLGPYFRALRDARDVSACVNWFAATGEQGVALYQALDDTGVRPDEEAELRHPAEDPAARLRGLIDAIESLARRHRATHVVFGGCGPTAAATALVCHARGARGVWLAPADPAGLIPRLRWERGLEAVIRALPEAVTVIEATFPPKPEEGIRGMEMPAEAPRGRRAEAPLVLMAVTRPAWGSGDVPERFIAIVADWARARPEADWLFLRSLDARFEGPIGAMGERPANFLTAAPVPYGVYRGWMEEARAVVTDSAAIAAEAMLGGIPVVALGEDAAMTGGDDPGMIHVVAGAPGGDRVNRFLDESLKAARSTAMPTGLWGVQRETLKGIESVLDNV